MATGNDRLEMEMDNINAREISKAAPECFLRTPALVGILGVLVGVAVGTYAYYDSRAALVDVIEESNLNLARSFAVHAEALDASMSRPDVLRALEEMWEATESRYAGRHLCVIDSDGTLVLDSSHPENAGMAAGAMRLVHGASDGPETIQQILDSGQDWAGLYSSDDGAHKAGAFAMSSHPGMLVNIFTPGVEIDRDVQSTALPWALGMGFMTLVVLPIVLWLPYRAYARSHRKLERKTEELRTENAERRRLAAFPRENPNPIMECNAAGEVIYHNPAAMELIGQHATGMTSVLIPEDHAALVRRCLTEGERIDPVEVQTDGRTFCWIYHPIPATDTVHLYGLDITDRRKAEDQIKRSLKEKEVLLQEVYHRVKNNLQIVSSLLRQQAATTEDAKARAVLEDSRDRIHSMALVHRQLYQSESLARVDMGRYIRNLASFLVPQQGSGSDEIRLELDVDRIEVDVATAIPAGLILNELLSNAMKYAYPQSPKGEVTVAFREVTPGTLSLTVQDSGVGIPAHVDLSEPQSLGLRLVRDLAQQLDGKLQIDNEEGTTVTLTFSTNGHDSESGSEANSKGGRR